MISLQAPIGSALFACLAALEAQKAKIHALACRRNAVFDTFNVDRGGLEVEVFVVGFVEKGCPENVNDYDGGDPGEPDSIGDVSAYSTLSWDEIELTEGEVEMFSESLIGDGA